MNLKNQIIFFILTSTFCYSQTDSLKVREIEIKSYEIDDYSNNKIDKREIKIDSVNIIAKLFENKIESTSFFSISKTELKTEYYFEDKELILVRFTEVGKSFEEDNAIEFSEYYYNCGEIFYEEFYTQLPSTAICMGIPIDEDWNLIYGFNKNFTNEFLHLYMSKLLTEIQNN